MKLKVCLLIVTALLVDTEHSAYGLDACPLWEADIELKMNKLRDCPLKVHCLGVLSTKLINDVWRLLTLLSADIESQVCEWCLLSAHSKCIIDGHQVHAS